MNYEGAVKNIRKELKTYIEDNRIKSLVMGMSGGIDSTLCALLAKPVCDELSIPLIGRSLPSRSNSDGENSRAKETGELFCTDFKEEDISIWLDVAVDVNESKYRVGDDERAIQDGNVKARIRMIKLYDLASITKGMVLSTDNYTELLLGFWTLHGDVGDYGMIQSLWKTEVYNMAEWIRQNELTDNEADAVLKVCLADATDGLGISKTDLEQILPGYEGTSIEGYNIVDEKLKDHLFKEDIIVSDNDPVIQRYKRTQFKRENPYNIPRNLITK